MTISQMREAIKAAYTGEKWAARIKTMTDKQVAAVYYRLLYLGRIQK